MKTPLICIRCDKVSRRKNKAGTVLSIKTSAGNYASVFLCANCFRKKCKAGHFAFTEHSPDNAES